MKKPLAHVDDTQLHTLLFSDEQDPTFQSAMTHVEACETCQVRLDELSGGEHLGDDLTGTEAFDAETRKMFDGHTADDLTAAYDRNAPDAPGISNAPASFDYLGPPSHPEMLGRLGRYEIERVVGTGGMGVVFKGFDTELHRPVAIKVLAQHLSHSGAARQRFGREAKAAAAVVHEHVVAIHNVEAEGDTPFLVMPYVAGESLQARVERAGALGVKEILRIGSQAAAGLQAAHEQGVVHRDIKPANILLEHGVERALVTDFGLAQTVDDASLTQTGIITGTPNYMSPEQATGKPTDPRTDLFSLGSVLYFMATGRPPFRAEKAMGVMHRICNDAHTPVWHDHPEISEELSDLIDRLLEKNPVHRPDSACQVQSELLKILANLQHPQPRHWLAIKRFFRRHRAVVKKAAWAACVAMVAIPVTWQLATQRTAKQQPESHASPVAATTTSLAPTPQVSAAPRQFSVETWQQASREEAKQWAGSIQLLDGQLDRVERSESTPIFPSPQWQQGLDGLHQQLNTIESNSIAR